MLQASTAGQKLRIASVDSEDIDIREMENVDPDKPKTKEPTMRGIVNDFVIQERERYQLYVANLSAAMHETAKFYAGRSKVLFYPSTALNAILTAKVVFPDPTLSRRVMMGAISAMVTAVQVTKNGLQIEDKSAIFARSSRNLDEKQMSLTRLFSWQKATHDELNTTKRNATKRNELEKIQMQQDDDYRDLRITLEDLVNDLPPSNCLELQANGAEFKCSFLNGEDGVPLIGVVFLLPSALLLFIMGNLCYSFWQHSKSPPPMEQNANQEAQHTNTPSAPEAS
jgi:hypothetical protein